MFFGVLLLVGCQESGDDSLGEDGNSTVETDDSISTDEPSEIGTTDAIAADTGVTDAGVTDTGVTDTGVTDTGVADTGVADTGVADAGVTDTDVTDTGVTDTGATDTVSDVGLPATEKNVFVTSRTYDANLGGLAGADAKCQASADAVGLLGEYKAWLSDGNVDAADRLSHATVPYRLVNGTQIASDWTALTTTDLLAPIDKDESGDAVAPTNMGTNCEDTDYSVVWTNSQEDGTTLFATYDCSDWTSTTNLESWSAVGSTKELSSWAYSCNNVDACQLFARLFCFEQ